MFRNRPACYTCNRRMIQREIRTFDDDMMKDMGLIYRDRNELPPSPLLPDSRLCFKCERAIQAEIELLEQNPDAIRMNIISRPNRHSCLVCNLRDNVIQISEECRVHIYVNRNIFVPEGAQSCINHLDDKGFLLRELQNGKILKDTKYCLLIYRRW